MGNNLKVEIKLEKGAILPKKGEPNAMCYDCYAYNIETLENGRVICDLGFSVKPPKGYGIRLIARSNLTKHYWVINNAIGIGDEDYKGNYKTIFTPLYMGVAYGMEDFPYKVGDRVCQMEIYKRNDFEFEQVEELSGNDRGGGFGSTGLN